MLLKIMLFLSAFAPLYLLVELNLIIEIINDNLHFNVLNTIMLALMLVLFVMGIMGIIILLNKKNTSTKIKIIKLNNITDQHFLGYFSLFVLFALSLDLSKISYAVVFLIIQVLIGIVYIKNSMFYVNPLLNIIGYSFYDIIYLDINENKIYSTRVFSKHNLKTNNTYNITHKNENMEIIQN